MSGILYLIPVTLGEELPPDAVIPRAVIDIIHSLNYFIAEEERSARRYLRKTGFPKPIQEIDIRPMGKHSEPATYAAYLERVVQGENAGLLSEAGCPGVADPGADIVRIAHEKNIRVVPLTGPSSLLLALMASGLNGQSFVFHGYLPIDKQQRTQKIKSMERDAQQKNQTQLFIETPFRNGQLLDDLLKTCENQTRLCIACDITAPEEYIRTQSIAHWKKETVQLHKRPAVFLLL